MKLAGYPLTGLDVTDKDGRRVSATRRQARGCVLLNRNHCRRGCDGRRNCHRLSRRHNLGRRPLSSHASHHIAATRHKPTHCRQEEGCLQLSVSCEQGAAKLQGAANQQAAQHEAPGVRRGRCHNERPADRVPEARRQGQGLGLRAAAAAHGGTDGRRATGCLVLTHRTKGERLARLRRRAHAALQGGR